MINDLLLMNGYAVYVLSAFSFTLLSFLSLYLVTKMQYVRAQKKFAAKFGSLTTEQAKFAKTQRINKEILANVTNN
tara:strand:- start:882 stop:1109 length:228 start_codon:yes stop_codon:yes gene_type:complete